MPEMDGFALAEQIKQHPELARATLLMLSSADQPRDVDRCRAAGRRPLPDQAVKQSELLDAIVTALSTSAADERGDRPPRPRRDRRAVAGPSRPPAHPAGRGQRRQPDAGGRPAREARAHGRRRRQRPGGARRAGASSRSTWC